MIPKNTANWSIMRAFWVSLIFKKDLHKLSVVNIGLVKAPYLALGHI